MYCKYVLDTRMIGMPFELQERWMVFQEVIPMFSGHERLVTDNQMK